MASGQELVRDVVMTRAGDGVHVAGRIGNFSDVAPKHCHDRRTRCVSRLPDAPSASGHTEFGFPGCVTKTAEGALPRSTNDRFPSSCL